MYIEANNLKDVEASSLVHPDSRMEEVFGSDALTLAQLTRVIKSHLTIPTILEGCDLDDRTGRNRFGIVGAIIGDKRESALSAVSKMMKKHKRTVAMMKKGTGESNNPKVRKMTNDK